MQLFYLAECVTVLGEADLVFHYVKCLIDAKVDPSNIAVIAPYNLQVHTGTMYVSRQKMFWSVTNLNCACYSTCNV